ncbi:MAG TPA: HAD family phosphatase [Candidatus Galloscillospira excrementipullorum]|nr:HAD family phosphatase [Candidatus Galloscillospira excrementipullorum]
MRFDLYIFDLDGTLVDTLEIWNEISLAFLARFGIVPTEQEIRAMDTMTFQEGSDYLRGHFGLPLSAEGLSEAWMETATEIFDSRVQLMPGALETLHVLRGRGAKLVIFPSLPAGWWRACWTGWGWIGRWTPCCWPVRPPSRRATRGRLPRLHRSLKRPFRARRRWTTPPTRWRRPRGPASTAAP